jgi:pimeloyl-ACP methyl ester carboxylesterase
MKNPQALAAAILAALLAGCGGGGTGDAGPGGTPAAPETPRPTGSLLQNPPARTLSLTAGALKRVMQDGPTRDQTLLSLAGDPICNVEVRYIQYTTVGGAGEATTSSGALMLPGGTDTRCTGARPIVLYGHATHPEKSFNIASLGDNTNPAYTESLTIAAIFAARGYIVVAPNYAGYDSSTLAYHPFLNGQQQSGEMLDALAAARTALGSITPQVTASNQLFLTGYSQGGYVALATQRALERAGRTVTASAPMSGPYAIARELDDNFAGQVHVASTLFASLIATSYQKTYGNVYATPSDLYESGYATGIETLLPGADVATLSKTGKLPESALFSKTAPTAPAGSNLQASFNALTPATGTAMDAIYARGFGAGNLFTNSFRAAYLQDMLTRPDNPNFGLRVDARANDLRGYTPGSPVFLCAGSKDATVSFANNTGTMAQAWSGLPAGRVTVLDIDDNPTNTNDTYFEEKLGFNGVKAATETQARLSGQDPDWEVARNYHAAVFPFCASAVGKFFGKF